MNLHVHLVERLLHALDLSGCFFDERLSMARISSKFCNLGFWSKARPQEAKGVEFLEPLAVEHVTLAAGHVASVSCIDEQDLEPTFLEKLV